jgi:hypothetical protein
MPAGEPAAPAQGGRRSATAATRGTCACGNQGLSALASADGISSCGWNINLAHQGRYFEVPRVGTVALPVLLPGNACPRDGARIVSNINVEGSRPVPCPANGSFERLEYRRDGAWNTETCASGAGGSYVLRSTLRGAARGECRAVTVETTDAKQHTIFFKYY